MAEGQWQLDVKRAHLNQRDMERRVCRNCIFGVFRGGNLGMPTSSMAGGHLRQGNSR